MPAQFQIKQANAFDKPYLKVQLLDISQLETIKRVLESSPLVRKCNVTKKDDIAFKKQDDLTIYINDFYTIDEANVELQKLLEEHFKGGVLLPQTKSIVTNVEHELTAYQPALDLYKKAISGLQGQQDYRHAMDDLRLSLELLLKEVLSNNKSIENQEKELCHFLGRKGISPKIIAIVKNDLQAIMRYFNEHIKHNDNVVYNEVDTITYLTSNIIHIILSSNQS